MQALGTLPSSSYQQYSSLTEKYLRAQGVELLATYMHRKKASRYPLIQAARWVTSLHRWGTFQSVKTALTTTFAFFGHLICAGMCR